MTLASDAYASVQPATAWPNASFSAFPRFASALLNLSGASTLSLAPLVSRAEAAGFLAFVAEAQPAAVSVAFPSDPPSIVENSESTASPSGAGVRPILLPIVHTWPAVIGHVNPFLEDALSFTLLGALARRAMDSQALVVSDLAFRR